MTDMGPTPAEPEEAAESAAETSLPAADAVEVDVRQGFITAVDVSTATYSFRYPESTADIGPGVHSVLPCSVDDTVWVLTKGGMVLILGPQDGGGVPPGAMMMWATGTAPDGWVIADGSSTAGYPRLAALFGATLPDMRTRVPVGQGTGFALGATGGSKEVTLTTAQMPGHTHSETRHTHGGGNHQHGMGNHTHQTTAANNMTQQSGWQHTGGAGFPWVHSNSGSPDTGPPSNNTTTSAGITTDQNAAANTGSTGGGDPHDNMPPYRVIHYIIKW